MFGILYSICFFICYLPQLYKTLVYKNVEGLSIWMFVLSLLGYIFMLLFMIYDIGFNWGMTINVAYGIPFCALIIYSINKYKL